MSLLNFSPINVKYGASVVKFNLVLCKFSTFFFYFNFIFLNTYHVISSSNSSFVFNVIGFIIMSIQLKFPISLKDI